MTPQFIEELVSLIVQIGPLGVSLFLKLENLLNLGPDEKQNIANAIAASNGADADTIARAAAWLKANGITPTFEVPPGT